MFWKLCEKVLDQMHSNKVGTFHAAPFLGVKHNAITLPSGLDLKFEGLQFKWKRLGGKAWVKEWHYFKYKTQKSQRDEVKIYGGMLTENLCQGIAGDVCKEAISRLIKFGHPPCGQVHDELLVVCDEDEVEKVKYLTAVAMTDPLPWWKQLPLEVEIGSGKNWLAAK